VRRSRSASNIAQVPATDLEVMLRFVVAAALGCGAGLERKYVAHRDAGSSTFALIALAAAVVTTLGFQLFDSAGASRVIANIMVGVGFLGGGTMSSRATIFTA
jgi:putative Mg2+ transporter-C (MgtC) family protein